MFDLEGFNEAERIVFKRSPTLGASNALNPGEKLQVTTTFGTVGEVADDHKSYVAVPLHWARDCEQSRKRAKSLLNGYRFRSDGDPLGFEVRVGNSTQWRLGIYVFLYLGCGVPHFIRERDPYQLLGYFEGHRNVCDSQGELIRHTTPHTTDILMGGLGHLGPRSPRNTLSGPTVNCSFLDRFQPVIPHYVGCPSAAPAYVFGYGSSVGSSKIEKA